MRNILFILLFLLSGYNLANSNECKPVVKKYPINQQATFQIIISHDLSFYTIEPKISFISGAMLYFDKDRSRYIGYDLLTEKAAEDKSQKIALLEALNLLPSTKDTEQFKKIFETDNCHAVEVETKNYLYKVYVVQIFKDKPIPFFNAYIVPTDDRDYMYSLQFRGFTEDEVGQQLATIKKEAK